LHLISRITVPQTQQMCASAGAAMAILPPSGL
jgi:hypothetical protein